MINTEDKVIQFKPQRSFEYKRSQNKEQILCSHIGVEINEETRSVHCQKCDIVLDPFEYLKKVCYQDEHAFYTHVQLKMEVEKLNKTYSNLIKEIARLKKLRNELK